MVAPSDMMDNRVGAIKSKLKEAGLGGKVQVIACIAYVTIEDTVCTIAGCCFELQC